MVLPSHCYLNLSMSLVLASQSPRRRQLLSSLGIDPVVSPGKVHEEKRADETAKQYVTRLAAEKCRDGIGRHTDCIVLGADTIGVTQHKGLELVLEKPLGKAHFIEMMNQLSDSWHTVSTAVAVGSNRDLQVVCVDTRVRVARLPTNFLEAYWSSGEPADKAGGYGIQGPFQAYIERIEGSFSAVMGLPLFETRCLLEQFGVSLNSMTQV